MIFLTSSGEYPDIKTILVPTLSFSSRFTRSRPFIPRITTSISAKSIAERLGTTWGIGEAGAAGPGNRYGDPAGHGWVAVAGPDEATRHVLTGVDDRPANMVAFASAALTLLVDTLRPS